MANSYYVEPTNPLAALMAGQQGYDTASKRTKDNQIEAARAQVASGNITPDQAFKILIGANDIPGAAAYGTEGHRVATEKLAQAQLANTQHIQSPEYIKQKARIEAKVANEYAPKTVDITQPGGEKVTVEKGPAGYKLPAIQGYVPPTGATAPPPGVDPKKWREQLAIKAATNEEDTVKSAKAAAEFKPFIDQAVAAYERAAKLDAIGPYVANPMARKANQLSLQTAAEKARQDYDQALQNVQLRITAAQNKGEGAVSNFERQMYKEQFPDLQALDPATKLQYLKQIQALTHQTLGAGSNSPLNMGSVPGQLNRPSVFPGAQNQPPAQSSTQQQPQLRPNAESIAYLKKHPNTAEQFDATYGSPGLAARFLGVVQ